MVTFFTIPKPFEGRTGSIQRKAIESWRAVSPDVEIVLFGRDKGVAEAAAAYGLEHRPDIQVNEFGTPLLNGAFDSIARTSRHQLIMYINADIILMPGLLRALGRIGLDRFLVVGRRWDLEGDVLTDIRAPGWEEKLAAEWSQRMTLHGYSGIDYLIFPRTVRIDMPVFAVGRPGWDNWFIWRAKQLKIPLIDATGVITALHQKHDYRHSKFGEKERVGGPETRKNYRLAGGFHRMMSIRDADWVLTPRGLQRPDIFRRSFALLSRYPFWQYLLSLKRKVQSA